MDGSFPITLTQLYNFKKLAEIEHMTQAAKALYITQPTLSLSIKALERELGIPLFFRDGRNIKLTKYGQEFYYGIEPMLANLESTVQTTRAHGNTLNGTLNIGTIPTIQYDFLPELLQQFWRQYGSEVKLRFTVEFSIPLTRGLKTQNHDLIFAAKTPVPSPSIAYIPMITTELVVVVREDSEFADCPTFCLNDLRGQPFASYNSDTPIGHEVHKVFAEHGIAPTAAFDDEFMLTSFVMANRNVPGIMTRTFEIDPFKKARIIPIKGMPHDFHTIYLAYDKQIYRRKIMDDFIEIATKLAQKKFDQKVSMTK